MKIWQTIASRRRDTAVQSLLELIRLFEAEALWESVETIRAVLERLRDWDLASRLFWQIDGASAPGAISAGRTRDFIAQHSAAVGSLLRSMTAMRSDAPDYLLEN